MMFLRTVLLLVFTAGVAVAARDIVLSSHESASGRFVADFPGKVKSSSRTVPSPAGGLTVTSEIATAKGQSDVVFAVAYTDYPATFANLDASKLLTAVRDGMKTRDGTIANEKDLVVDGDRPAGIEVQFDYGKTHARAHLHLIGTRLYQVTVTGTKDDVESKPASLFLASFKLRK